MNKILVLYRSKYGASLRYAKMLKDAVSCDVIEISRYPFDTVGEYDLIVAVGGIYASGISCMKQIRKHIQALSDRKLVIFAVGASPFYEKAFEEVREHNLKGLPPDIPMFYGRGTYDESRMDFKDRTLCRMLKKSLSKKDPSAFEPWMKALFEADGKGSDWIDEKYLEPLVEYIKLQM